MIDVTHEINAFQRQVGTRILEAGEARTITIARTYDADVDDIWDACTNPERIRRWFLPVSGDLREGGHYQIEGNASGTILRCTPPSGFSATWEFGGEVSWIELQLTPEPNGRTRFQLEHTAHVSDERWAQFGPGALGVGWDLGLLGLAGHLASRPTLDPGAAMAWVASAEGKHYIALSSAAWQAASLAAGTDPTMAQAAADRTMAFYTGAPEGSGVS
jgi:uncharacterized protein YndB with AHSA1/START domain